MLELSSIVVAVGIAVLASLFSPEGKTKKWVNFVLGLVAFTVLATPLLSLDAGAFLPGHSGETAEPSGEPMEMLLELSADELEKKVSAAFGIPLEQIEVNLDQAAEKKIKVKVPPKTEQSRYFKQLLGEEWEVSFFGG